MNREKLRISAVGTFKNSNFWSLFESAKTWEVQPRSNIQKSENKMGNLRKAGHISNLT